MATIHKKIQMKFLMKLPVWNFGADFARKRGEIEAKSMFSGRDGGVTAFSARNIALLSGSTGGSQLLLRA